MKDSFLNEVNSILGQNLENEKFGVNELSEALNISRSQLFRNFKKFTNKSTSQFIREYRLEKAHELLIDHNFTSSEVAYKVGFSSPTYFNSSFRRYYGYTPGEARFHNPDDYDPGNSPKQNKKPKSYSKWAMGSVLLLAILTIFIVSSQLDTSKNSLENPSKQGPLSHEISIAVLPFNNLSNDKENEYFAYGMREDIMNKISKIQNVIVKSPHSIEDYIKQDSSLNEIAQHLGADYLVTGSVQKFKEKVKIIINLIETETDHIKISKSFEGTYKDIFDLERKISQEIATELNLTISPEQLQLIQKQPTQNPDAYQLYQKGRYFYYLGAEDSNELAYYYFQQCIKLDDHFAMAYVGLADLIDASHWPWVPEEKYEEMEQYALKAMSIDETIPDPHKILAKIYMRQQHNWEAAEREFKLALKINPDHEESNIEYGIFLAFVRGDFENAQKLFQKVEENNPLSIYSLASSADAYLAEGNCIKARQQIEKAKEFPMTGLWPGWIYWDSFLIYALEGKDDLAVNELKIGWEYDSEAKKNIKPLMEVYAENGVMGIFEWFIELNKGTIDPESDDEYKNGIGIAEHYAVVGNEEKAIENLETAIRNKNVEIYTIKYEPLLFNLRNNPKFIEILKRLGLGDYVDRSFLP